MTGRQIDRSGVSPKDFIAALQTDDAVAGEERNRWHFRLAVCNDLVHGEAIIALNASPYVPGRTERTGTCVGWLNFSLETSYEWFTLLRGNGDYHRCHQKKPQSDGPDFAGLLHN